MFRRILKMFLRGKKKKKEEILDIPKTANNKLVSIGDAWVRIRNKKALDDGMPLIIYNEDGTHSTHMPGGELHKKLSERRW